MTIPFFLIDGMYTRGEFTVSDAHQTANALFFYGWGVPAFVAAQLFNRAFFARQDTQTPMRLGLVSVGVNVAVGVTLFYLIGVPGVAAATTVAWWTNVAMMATVLARRSHYRPAPEAVARLVRILIANVALGVLLFAAGHWRSHIQGLFGHFHISRIGPKEFAVGLVAVAAGTVYPALLFGTGGMTLSEVRGALRSRRVKPEDLS